METICCILSLVLTKPSPGVSVFSPQVCLYSVPCVDRIVPRCVCILSLVLTEQSPGVSVCCPLC